VRATLPVLLLALLLVPGARLALAKPDGTVDGR